MSAGLKAVQEGQAFASALAEHERGTEHQPARTPEQEFVAFVDEALKHERKWVPSLLTRGDQQLGGIIVIGDVNLYEKVVALIDSRCGGHAAPLAQLDPTEEVK